jgi:hypothetical protein
MLEAPALVACSAAGFALIALTQPQHRLRAAGTPALDPRKALRRRLLGAAFLAASAAVAIWRQGASFGAILWVLSLSAGALLVAAVLAWRPRLLRRLC